MVWGEWDRETELDIEQRSTEHEQPAAVISAATDSPQATSQPQASEAPAKKAGIGRGDWNEDFDEAWGRRVLEDTKIKELFGLSDYSSLRDSSVRDEINKYLRKQKAATDSSASAPAAAASSTTSTTGAGTGDKKPAAPQPAGTTGKATVPGSKPPGLIAGTKPSVLPSGRLPRGLLWPTTTLPASGGEIPAMPGPWWPSYPVGGGTPPATQPATGSALFQAGALERS